MPRKRKGVIPPSPSGEEEVAPKPTIEIVPITTSEIRQGDTIRITYMGTATFNSATNTWVTQEDDGRRIHHNLRELEHATIVRVVNHSLPQPDLDDLVLDEMSDTPVNSTPLADWEREVLNMVPRVPNRRYPDGYVIDGMRITASPPERQQVAVRQYRDFLARREQERLRDAELRVRYRQGDAVHQRSTEPVNGLRFPSVGFDVSSLYVTNVTLDPPTPSDPELTSLFDGRPITNDADDELTDEEE